MGNEVFSLLYNKLKKWADNNLISQEQADSILLFEKKHRVWQGGLVVFLGIIAAALGVSAIIGANWEIIPGWLKLSANGVLLALLAWCGYVFFRQGMAYEFALFFICCLFWPLLG